MATLKINLENGFFISTNGRYVSSVEPTRVIANGWDCLIDEDGTITCKAVREYSDGEHSMRYQIKPNGFAKLTLKVPFDKVKTLRKGFVTPKGSKLSDGVLGLAGGDIDERYAYFRDSSFQKFLDKFGISAVKHEDPKQEFWGSTIRGNSWAIVEKDDYHRFLYTTESNVMSLDSSLMEHPKVAEDVKKRDQSRRLKALDGREINSLADIIQVASEILSIAPKLESAVTPANYEVIQEFLDSFPVEEKEEEKDYRFMLEALGPLVANPFMDYCFVLERGNNHTCHAKKLALISGELG